MVVETASKFDADVSLVKDGVRADARSIMSRVSSGRAARSLRSAKSASFGKGMTLRRRMRMRPRRRETASSVPRVTGGRK